MLWTGESHIGRAEAARAMTGTADRITMIFDERGVYVLSRTGASGFIANGKSAGQRLWIMQVEGAATIPAFGNDGVLYSGGNDWILYAYKLEDRVLQQQQSLYGPVPEGNYGAGSPPPSPWANYYFGFEEKALNIQFALIRRAIDSGQVGEQELTYTGYLMEVLRNDLPRPGISRLHPQVQILQRIQALHLLGLLGSPEIIPFLADIFSRDDEALVKAAAAEAIGSIGIDPDGLALRAFTNAIFAPGTVRDEQALLGIAAATGALCRFSGPPLSDTGVKILTSLIAAGRPQSVQQRARRELSLMGK